MKNIAFSLSAYEELINIIKNSNRKTIFFDELIKGKNGLMMRHDIDFSPSKACQIAEIEYRYKVFSTYFVMLKSDLYNLNDINNIQYIKHIISLGHKVGLHFDASFYDKKNISLELACKKECDILANKINCEIDIISFHRPEKKFIGRVSKIAGRNHTYMPLFIKDTNYCSDSQGSWRFGEPEKLINNHLIKNIQLLTHPIWWTTPENMTPGEKIDFHLRGEIEEIKSLAAKNCKPYKIYLELKGKQIAK